MGAVPVKAPSNRRRFIASYRVTVTFEQSRKLCSSAHMSLTKEDEFVVHFFVALFLCGGTIGWVLKKIRYSNIFAKAQSLFFVFSLS